MVRLHLVFRAVDGGDARDHERRQHRLQIGPGARTCSSSDQITRASNVLLGQVDGLPPGPRTTSGLMACIFVLMLAISTCVVQCPDAGSRRFLRTQSCLRCSATSDAPLRRATSSRKVLAAGRPADCAARHEPCPQVGAPGTAARVWTPPASATGPANTQAGRGALHKALARHRCHPAPWLRHFQPARLLPQLERSLLDAESPAHGQVDVTRSLGHRVPGAPRRNGSWSRSRAHRKRTLRHLRHCAAGFRRSSGRAS